MLKAIFPAIFFVIASNAVAQTQLDLHSECQGNGDDTYRILFIGDSITRHGFSDESKKRLGWSHLSGMAASSAENDYVSIFSGKVSAHTSKQVISCYHTFGGSGKVAQRLAAMNQIAHTKPDLVVIQLGEHEKESEGAIALENDYTQLIKLAKQINSSPKVIAVGPWSLSKRKPNGEYQGWPGTVDEIMRKVAAREGIQYSSVRDFSGIPEARGWGTSEGVKWHPNDLGHALYAARIYRLFLQANQPR